MPKTSSGGWQGNFATYAGGSSGGAFASDEEAISKAIDNMFSDCGNPGQERLIGDFVGDFEDWAYAVLETEDGDSSDWGSFANMVKLEWYEGRQDKWHGSYLIWRDGWVTTARQYGFHDSGDEYGEGEGL